VSKFSTVIILLVSLLGAPHSAFSQDGQQTVIMIGIDGLRADAIDRAPAPALRALAARGVRAEGMRPAMPSKTFVNFYSLATGLHPMHHGVVSNYPYDRKMGRAFNRATDTRDPAWWGGEPIWITAEKQGVKAATYFWVGSEVAIDGIQPTFWKPYDQNKDYGERVDEVLSWLKLPADERPRLITLYFSAVDTVAHRFGVGSTEEMAAIAQVDGHVGDLIAGLKAEGMMDQTDIIIVADHGMVNLSDDKMINLDPLVDLSAFEVPDWNKAYGPAYAPFLNLYGDDADVEATYQKLVGKHPHLQVLRRGAFPENYHFDHPDRGPDLMLLADTGWTIYASVDNTPPLPFRKTKNAIATHGYDNYDPLMQATFIAAGPAFKSGVIAPTFDNVEVYGILACALDITPAKTDGDIKNVQGFMTKECE
jgi:alkaline phosphatase D